MATAKARTKDKARTKAKTKAVAFRRQTMQVITVTLAIMETLETMGLVPVAAPGTVTAVTAMPTTAMAMETEIVKVRVAAAVEPEVITAATVEPVETSTATVEPVETSTASVEPAETSTASVGTEGTARVKRP